MWGMVVDCCMVLDFMVERGGKILVLRVVLFGFTFGFSVRFCSVFPCFSEDLHDLHMPYCYDY